MPTVEPYRPTSCLLWNPTGLHHAYCVRMLQCATEDHLATTPKNSQAQTNKKKKAKLEFFKPQELLSVTTDSQPYASRSLHRANVYSRVVQR